MMVQTWDDYEEGTEIETGISNCIDDSQSTATIPINTTTLNWTFAFSDPTWGTANTIHHYILYYRTSTGGYKAKDANITPLKGACKETNDGTTNVVTCHMDLSTYTWSGSGYAVYVQAVGMSGLTNHTTPSVAWK